MVLLLSLMAQINGKEYSCFLKDNLFINMRSHPEIRNDDVFVTGDNLHCPPLERPYRSAILGHYPEHVPWNTFDSAAVCMVSTSGLPY